MADVNAQAPDSTAERVALWRAMHVQVDATPHVLEDEIGLQLLAPDAGWKARGDMDPVGTRGFRAAIVARARFIEDLVAERPGAGVLQYVLLGAGLDTFAQRRPELASTLRVFEIDQPGTQAWKRQRLIQLGFGIPEWLRLVPVDFEADESWWQQLTGAGFDLGRPAVVASTGVAMYLTKEATAANLRQLAGLAPGSTLAMTFLLPPELLDDADRAGLQASQKGARASGTPFVSFYQPPEMLALAREAGFKEVRHVSGAALADRYFADRADGLRPSFGEDFIIAATRGRLAGRFEIPDHLDGVCQQRARLGNFCHDSACQCHALAGRTAGGVEHEPGSASAWSGFPSPHRSGTRRRCPVSGVPGPADGLNPPRPSPLSGDAPFADWGFTQQRASPPMSTPGSHLEHPHLAVALDGAGWHPAAWREPDARPDQLFDARYWAELVTEAERGLLDFVTIEDSLGLQSSRYGVLDGRTDQVRGRLDAVLVAARVAPLTRHIGLIPTAVVTHTEPFHLSKAIATLDYVSNGRAGLRVQVSGREYEAALFGRRQFPAIRRRDLSEPASRRIVEDLFEEAADYVEVVRRLWDSWEDDAEIRDVTTGRFIDRGKLHYIDFESRFFSVKGPSITPRPPQGQPIVAALGHQSIPFALIARCADVGFITPRDGADAREIIGEIRAGQQAAGRAQETVHVFADVTVFLDDDPDVAAQRKERLDGLAGSEFASDAKVFVGSPQELADLLLDWHGAGVSGFRLRPGALPHDLTAITRRLVPELQRRGAFRTAYESSTLRGLLGLARPTNRYAAA